MCATSSRTCFVIISTEALSRSLITISLFMLYRRRRNFALVAIAAPVCSLRRATVAACYFFRIVNLSFMQFCCWDCCFARDSMLSSFCHIYAGVGLQRVVSAYLILTRGIFTTCSMGILLLVLIFSCIDFRYSTVRAPFSITFACWVSIEGQCAAIIAPLSPVRG